MLHEIAVEAGKSIWRDVGEEVLKKGATAVVVEGTKAILDVLKRRRIRRDEWEFQQWKKAQEPEDSDGDSDEKSDEGEDKKADEESAEKPDEDSNEEESKESQPGDDPDAKPPED